MDAEERIERWDSKLDELIEDRARTNRKEEVHSCKHGKSTCNNK